MDVKSAMLRLAFGRTLLSSRSALVEKGQVIRGCRLLAEVPRLPFGVEADALYRPLQNLVQVRENTVESVSSNSGSWEFPILAKYHFLPLPIANPYIDAGPSFRSVSGNEGNFSSAGFTLGAGVEVKLMRLRLEPEFRYIRWGADKTPGYGQSIPSGPSAAPVPSNHNQVEFLVGLAF